MLGARRGGAGGRGGAAGGRGGAAGELVFSRDRGSVWEDEKVQAVDGGGSCTAE